MALEHNQIVCPYCGNIEDVESFYEEVIDEIYSGGSFFNVFTDVFCPTCEKQMAISIASMKIEFTVDKPIED